MLGKSFYREMTSGCIFKEVLEPFNKTVTCSKTVADVETDRYEKIHKAPSGQ